MIDLQSWENTVLGQHLDSDGVKKDRGQCSQVPIAWAQALFPGKPWNELLVALGSDVGVSAWAGKSTKYFTWIDNNHSDINQLPLPGDIMVFEPDHTGVVKSASVSGYTLIEQNAPALGSGVHDTSYSWRQRNCLGWFRPKDQFILASVPVPPAPVMSTQVSRTLHLPKTVKTWRVYNPDGPYDIAHATHVLAPAKFGGLSYEIKADRGNGIYLIDTQDFGRVAIWTSNTDATIS